MTQNDRKQQLKLELSRIDLLILAARLKAARSQKFHKIAEAIAALSEEWGIGRSRYYSHEGGDRRPKFEDLERYALLFEVPVDFFLYGDNRIVSDDYVDALVVAKKAEGSGGGNQKNINDYKDQVNQNSSQNVVKSSHNRGIRTIVWLSAGEIKALSKDRGVLTRMSGKRLPMPTLIDVSENSFWHQIPKHDLSMVSTNPLFSLNPGAIVLVDLDEPVAPGHCVLADLAHVEQPVVRQYKAVTDRERNALFALEPLNPAYETIYISDPSDFVTLGRVVFFGNKI